MTGLSTAQYDYLIARLKASRVQQHKGNSYVEAWDVKRHLIRIFGFGGYDTETKVEVVAQIEHPTLDGKGQPVPGGKSRWTVVYRAHMRLIVKDPAGTPIAFHEEVACGDSANQPSLGDAHDNASKSAVSGALKRCATNWGDQFGLGLYNDGKTDPVVTKSLVAPGATVDANELDAVAARDAPVVPEERRADESTATQLVDMTEPEIRDEEGDIQQHALPPVDEPRAAPAAGAAMVTEDQHKRMHVNWRRLGYDGDPNRATRIQITSKFIGRGVTSSRQLTAAEADTVIQQQEARLKALRERGTARAAEPVGANA
jgi:hypothetical protein